MRGDEDLSLLLPYPPCCLQSSCSNFSSLSLAVIDCTSHFCVLAQGGACICLEGGVCHMYECPTPPLVWLEYVLVLFVLSTLLAALSAAAAGTRGRWWWRWWWGSEPGPRAHAGAQAAKKTTYAALQLSSGTGTWPESAGSSSV